MRRICLVARKNDWLNALKCENSGSFGRNSGSGLCQFGGRAEHDGARVAADLARAVDGGYARGFSGIAVGFD